MQEDTVKPGFNVVEIVSRRRVAAGIAFAIAVVLTFVAVFVFKPSYSASAHVLLVNDQNGRDPVTEGVDMPTIATSTAVLDGVRDRLHLNRTAEELRKKITVKVSPKSSIMTVVAKDHDPNLAVALANALADNFTTFYSTVSGARYQNVIGQLRTDLQSHRTRMLALESRLQRAASSSAYVGSQSSLDNTASALNDLVTQRTMAYASLVSDEAQLASARTQPAQLSKIIRHETLTNDQPYRQLEIEVSHDTAQLAMVKSNYSDRFPGLPGAEAKVSKELGQLHTFADTALNGPTAYSPSLAGQIVIEQRAAASVDGDRARVKAIDAQIAATRDDLNSIPDSGVSIGAIRALRDAEEAQFQALSLRLSNAQANSAEANSLGSAVLIDRAETAQPSLVGTNLLLALGLLVSIALAIGAAYAVESLNPRFLSPGDVESVYGRPVVGSIDTV